MREYRGNRKDNGERVYGSFLGGRLCHIMSHASIKKTDTTSMFAGYEVVPVIRETVGQSTGLRDNSGKEGLYANDIITFLPMDESTQKPQWGKIYYCENRAAFCVKGIRGFVWDCPLALCKELEKIGNIHDNPELLEAIQ